uniref:DUF402 domain-containing protein n=1 Tax=Thermofilum pendens TaxID=2269 RepID=A0A7C4FF82_THEPE
MLRIRGIYATALTGLLDDFGYMFTDLTEKVRERVPSARVRGRGVAVTVKDLEDKKGVVVVGDPELVPHVAYAIAAAVPGSMTVYLEAGPYTTFLVRIIERLQEGLYVVKLPGAARALLSSRHPLKEGELTAGYVVRPGEENPLLAQGIALTGTYVRLIEGGRHGVSEHFKDTALAAEMLTLAQMTAPEGWGVRIRSAAQNATLLEVASEIRELSERAETLRKVARERNGPALLAQGESIAFIHFSPDAAARLDSIRNRYSVTAPLHHLLKSTGVKQLSDYVDRVELEGSATFSEMAKLYAGLFRKILESGRVRLVHKKLPSGEFSWQADACLAPKGVILLSRSVRSEGVYDGLGIHKIPGDKILSFTWPLARVVAHFYFSKEGEAKGVYVNVNTPLEVAGADALKYIDLAIDVVKIGGEIRIIDKEKFETLVSRGILLGRDAKEYTCLVEKIVDALSGFDAPIEVATRLLEAQDTCFAGEPLEEYKYEILRNMM